MPRTGLLLVGHGSRDAATRLEHDTLEGRVREAFPDHVVASGFIELSEPPLSKALSEMAVRCDRVVVVPLLLFTGGHMQRDVPAAIEQAKRAAPNTQFVVTAPFGTSDTTLQLASTRVREAMASVSDGTVLLIGRGAAEEQAQREFQSVRNALEAMHPAWQFEVAYCGVQQPSVPIALQALASAGARHVVVLPYLLFTGRLLQGIVAAVTQVRADRVGSEIVLCPQLGPDVVVAVADAVRTACRVEGPPGLPKS